MPISNLSWLVGRKPPVFQVFGTKRKMMCTDNVPQENMDTMVGDTSKRLCVRVPDPMHAMNEMLEVNHNSIQQPSANIGMATHQQMAFHSQVQVPPYDHPTSHPHHIESQHVSNNSHQTNVIFSQNITSTADNVMDLCDETYSTSQMTEISEQSDAASMMDSDYVPDSSQYRSGDYYTPSQVRCFCKPSWDGQDMKPYVSDYY